MNNDDWISKAFEKHYVSIYNYRDDKEADSHINFIAEKAFLESKDIRVLDLCCGTARYTRLLKKRNMNVTGLDYSKDLLEIAKKEDPEGEYIQGDMRELSFAKPFDRILSLFTSFGYFEDDKTNASVLKQMSNSLVESGFLYLDFLNPHTVSESDWVTKKQSEGTLKTKKSIDSKSNMVIKNVEWHGLDGRVENYDERVKLYPFEWFVENAKQADLNLKGSWGDYGGGELTQKSPRNIYLFQKSQLFDT